MTKWQLERIYYDADDHADVDQMLADGWEPFAVTTETGPPRIWLRRIAPVIQNHDWKAIVAPDELVAMIKQAADSAYGVTPSADSDR